MSPILDRALDILRCRGPISAADLGWALWGETTECPGRGEGSHQNNKFCRAAGRVLRRLEREQRAWVSVYGRRMLWKASVT